MTQQQPSPDTTPARNHVRDVLTGQVADADLVDRIFEYLVELCPEVGKVRVQAEAAVRSEFAGDERYVRSRSALQRQQLAQRVLSLFNGRNATEVARRLDISRATVYRLLKQSGPR